MTGGCPALMAAFAAYLRGIRCAASFGMIWPLPPVWVRQPRKMAARCCCLCRVSVGDAQSDAVLADGAEPLPRFWGVRPADAVIVDGAEPLPPAWGDASAPNPAFRMSFAACLGYALKISSETGSPALAACLGGTLEENGLPGKGHLGRGQCFGGFRWRPLMGPKGGALPSVRLRLRLRKPSRSTDRGHAKAARMQAQETLSMGRAGLTSADARTLAKRGRITARAEARTGRSRMPGRETFQMWNGKLGRGAAAWGQGCPDAGAGNIEHGKGGPYIDRCPDAGETGPHKGPCRSPHRQMPGSGAGNHAAHSRHPRLVIDKALWKAA